MGTFDVYYNVTGLSGQTDLFQMTTYVNDNFFGGYLGAGILIMFFVVIYFALRNKTPFASDAFAGAGVANLLLALILLPLGILDQWSWYISLTIGIGSIFILIINRNQ